MAFYREVGCGPAGKFPAARKGCRASQIDFLLSGIPVTRVQEVFLNTEKAVAQVRQAFLRAGRGEGAGKAFK